jgi:hypothetical protein
MGDHARKPARRCTYPRRVSAQKPGAFSSQVESLGGSENATKQKLRAFPVNERERETL